MAISPLLVDLPEDLRIAPDKQNRMRNAVNVRRIILALIILAALPPAPHAFAPLRRLRFPLHEIRQDSRAFRFVRPAPAGRLIGGQGRDPRT